MLLSSGLSDIDRRARQHELDAFWYHFFGHGVKLIVSVLSPTGTKEAIAMPKSLQNKVIIISGGSTGIGRAAAFACVEAGATVVIADINAAAAEITVQELGDRAQFIATDVTDANQVQNLVSSTVERCGGLDGAFNNAGIEGDFANITKMSEAAFDRTVNVDLKGVWLSVKYEIQQLLAQGRGGSIVNTASVAGLVGTRGGTAYCAAKHGVVGLTKSAALEFARKKIRVNAVCPGVIQTPMVERLKQENGIDEASFVAQEPMDRLGEPAEVGAAVVWLLSDQASFVTGAAIPVDGGFVAQ